MLRRIRSESIPACPGSLLGTGDRAVGRGGAGGDPLAHAAAAACGCRCPRCGSSARRSGSAARGTGSATSSSWRLRTLAVRAAGPGRGPAAAGARSRWCPTGQSGDAVPRGAARRQPEHGGHGRGRPADRAGQDPRRQPLPALPAGAVGQPDPGRGHAAGRLRGPLDQLRGPARGAVALPGPARAAGRQGGPGAGRPDARPRRRRRPPAARAGHRQRFPAVQLDQGRFLRCCPPIPHIQLESTAPAEPPPNLAILRAVGRRRRRRGPAACRSRSNVGNFTPTAAQADGRRRRSASSSAGWRPSARPQAARRRWPTRPRSAARGWQSGEARLVGVDDALAADNVRPAGRPAPPPADLRPGDPRAGQPPAVVEPFPRMRPGARRAASQGSRASAAVLRLDPADLGRQDASPRPTWCAWIIPGKLSDEAVKTAGRPAAPRPAACCTWPASGSTRRT